MSPDLLSRRALNRTTLHRQRLLSRGGDIEETIEHLLGLQTQNPLDPYFALACRLDNFAPEQLGQLLTDRVVVRTAVMRGTLHLLTSADYKQLQPTFAPVLERVFNSTSFATDIAGMNRSELLSAAEKLLAREPMTRADLGRQLETRWPDTPGASMAHAATYLLPVVQTTPRGVWGAKGAATWAPSRQWLGDGDSKPEPLDQIVLRYLAAFGPASVADIRVWSGLTGLREVLDGIRHRLRTWKDEDGKELFDLPDAVHPDPETPAPPRFLPEYDNVLLGHADRSRFFLDGATPAGWVGNLLVDGFFAGSWEMKEPRPSMCLMVTPHTKLTHGQRHEVECEGYQLLSTLSSDARETSVEIGSPNSPASQESINSAVSVEGAVRR